MLDLLLFTQLNQLLVMVILILLFLLLVPKIRDVISGFIAGKYSVTMVIYILIGIICYVVLFFFTEDTAASQNFISKIIEKIGDLFILGAFLGLVTNTSRFMSIFRDVTFKELLSENNLLKRKDLWEIWERVSKLMFKNRYPSISTKILKIIKEGYFPNKEKGYYDNYTVEHSLEFVDDEHIYVKLTETVRFTYVTDSTSKFDFEQKPRCRKLDAQDHQTRVSLISYKVNGVDVTDKTVTRTVLEGHNLTLYITQKLMGATRYNIEIKQEKVYKFDDDYDISFIPRRITNNLMANLRYPDDIYVNFIALGTIGEYQETLVHNNFEIRYNGVILPKQGYSFLLRKV